MRRGRLDARAEDHAEPGARRRPRRRALPEPIEQCVSAADAVDHAALEADARRLVAAQPLLAKLVGALGDAQPLWAALAGCPLPPPLAFRLTVVRGQRAALYEHSLRAAAVALWLALRIGRLRRQLYEAGLGPDLAVFADGTFATDPVARAEHAALVREASWQLRQIAIETTCRWPELADTGRTSPLAPLAHWLIEVDAATRPV